MKFEDAMRRILSAPPLPKKPKRKNQSKNEGGYTPENFTARPLFKVEESPKIAREIHSASNYQKAI